MRERGEERVRQWERHKCFLGLGIQWGHLHSTGKWNSEWKVKREEKTGKSNGRCRGKERMLGQSKDSVKVELPKCMQQFVDKDVRQSMSSAMCVCVFVLVRVCVCACVHVCLPDSVLWFKINALFTHLVRGGNRKRQKEKKERTKLHNKFHFELLTFNSNGHAPSLFTTAHSNCSCNLQHSNCNCNLQLLRIVINFLTVACLVSSRALNWQIKRIVPASAAASVAAPVAAFVVGLVKPTAQARQQ